MKKIDEIKSTLENHLQDIVDAMDFDFINITNCAE